MVTDQNAIMVTWGAIESKQANKETILSVDNMQAHVIVTGKNEISVKFSMFNQMERPEASRYDKRSHEEAMS